MFPYLKLIRYQNLLIIAVTQYLMRWSIIYPILKVNNFHLQFSEFNFFLLVLSTIFLAAAGYVINDYFDRKTDLLNRPDNVIVGTVIKRRVAMILHIVMNIIGIGLGIYISFSIGIYKLGFIYIIVAGILWYYSTSYKRHFLTGNIIVALLTALVPLMVVLYEIPLLNKEYREILLEYNANFNNILVWVAGFSFFAFITTLIREIIKDIEDFEGDNAFDRNTLPIMLGIFYTKIVVTVLIFVAIFSLCFIYFKYLNDTITFLYFLIALLLPLFFLIYKIIQSKNKTHYHFASNLTKFIMLTGLLYSMVANYIFGTSL